MLKEALKSLSLTFTLQDPIMASTSSELVKSVIEAGQDRQLPLKIYELIPQILRQTPSTLALPSEQE